MKRSEKIGICVKFQKSFIRLRVVDLLKSKQEDLVVQVRKRNDVSTFLRFRKFFFKLFF